MSLLASGTVTELHRWPVKSMAGEPVQALRVDERGVGGDRTHALFDRFKDAPRRLTARQAPGLLSWRADYGGADVDPDDPPLPRLTAPDGTARAWDDPGLPAALTASLDREVLPARNLAGQQDLERSVLITTQATLDALGAELGGAIDLRRFRTNVHCVLDAAPYDEEGWEGATVTIGAARMVLLHPCERCVIPTRDPDTQVKWGELLRHLTRAHRGLFGMNARPLGPARIAVGDPIAFSG